MKAGKSPPKQASYPNYRDGRQHQGCPDKPLFWPSIPPQCLGYPSKLTVAWRCLYGGNAAEVTVHGQQAVFTLSARNGHSRDLCV